MLSGRLVFHHIIASFKKILTSGHSQNMWTSVSFWKRQRSHLGESFMLHFIEREIGGNNVVYEFKLKASQFIFNGDFERNFVDNLYIRHLFFKIDFDDGRREGPFCKQ